MSDTSDYEIKFYPRGPKSTEWKIWPKAGGAAVATGVAGKFTEAQLAAKKALERLSKA
jgi:hypothetical protein